MQYVLGIVAILTTLITAVAILHKVWNRQTTLLSYRNLFLLGFFFFYGLATTFVVFMDQSGWIYQPQGPGYLPLAIMTPGFAIIFVLFAKWGYKSNGLAKLVPSIRIHPCTASIFAGIIVCEIMGIIGLTPLGDYFTGVISQSKAGMAACAAGLATYWLIAKRYNPIAWVVFLATFALSCLISVAGGTDRRFVIGVFIVVAWVWYFTTMQYRSPGSVLTKFSIAGLAGLGFIIFYSNFRNVRIEDTTFSRRIEQFGEAAKDPLNIKKNTLGTVFYQDAPINTLYIIESYPDFQELKPFHGLIFFMVNPIPRAIFPDKPLGLGHELQLQFGIAANLGPGIIGHGWAEGMWFGVIGYAAFFGVLCGVIDRKTETQANNPFFLAVFGSSLGNVLGLCRGETSLFLVLIVTGWITTCGVLWLINAIGKSTFAAWPRLYVDSDYYMEQQAIAEQQLHDFEAYESNEGRYDPAIAAHYNEDTESDEHRHSA